MWIWALASGCAAYESGSSPDPAVRRPALWTLFDVKQAFDEGRHVAVAAGMPDGVDPQEILAPAADRSATLRIVPAYSEGAPAAYVMPELWTDFDDVWVQPWYVLITAWDANSPSQDKVKDASGNPVPPVFDVGPRSLFYSPLWFVYYAVLPAGEDPARYTSAEQIFDDGLEIHPGIPWTYSVRPDDVTLGASPPVHPFLGTPVASFLSAAPPA